MRVGAYSGFELPLGSLPAVATAQMREVDRRMTEDFHIDISAPSRLYRQMGLDVPMLFGRSGVARLVGDSKGGSDD